ncbi:DUF4236 domain-containing protein [Weissella paramesenteroides]|uniref:DUF4236 domain-containing protein n=1 Tax=Weissella paramesenteroides TaxID=1249 RepID=UPI001239B722|nr:DUF4236 domain-containing protein [Weissella paramesenteroides]KAA8441019.1 DUF4236 domain-containing protein [Weissella paramesenteroides]KAA8441203.1 DUF4236 domain-containing protein [Weissella paramesenteroides]KAA8443451.1 DUF4236 domain-containing protein [Weissella paramesenteroides]KAA8447739.1 DUF4236 domain-containing protein [Weissella paramesenteroides]KAA8449658.1 DUF4236 domain-containing protein [Weissella paramesenteroides]
MGFRYRKSKNFGPFRINVSKSGVGWSVGGKGFRYTKKANGGTRATTSIPGSGMSWVKDSSKHETIQSRSKLHSIEKNNVSIATQKRIPTYLIIIIAFIIMFIGILYL